MIPIIKWPGGKRRLLPELVANMPEAYVRYIEPFLGGGALFFHLEPRGAILGDSNEQLVGMYQAIKSNHKRVGELLGTLAERHSEITYYQVRKSFNSYIKLHNGYPTASVAAYFIYLNKTCFNGLWRVNKKGEFNVPYGKYEKPSLPSADELGRAAECLERSSLRVAHFAETILLAQRGDFIYADPPYDLPQGHHNYTAAGFDQEEQTKLRDFLKMKGDRGIKWMASNSDTSFIRELYAGYNIVEVKAARSINSKGDGRGKITELLIKNY